MPRYSAVYSRFTNNLREVELVRRLADNLEKKYGPKKADEIQALCRGAIVLLCSHLEAFTKELGEAGVDGIFINKVDRSKLPDQFFFHISKELIQEVSGAQDPAVIAKKVFSFIDLHAGFWQRKGPFLSGIQMDTFNKGFSTPKYEKIRKYFNRFSYDTFHGDLSAKLKGDFGIVTNSVDHLVDTRNNIAHGDASATKTPGEIKVLMDLTRTFCRETDVAFCNWWKKNYCPIR